MAVQFSTAVRNARLDATETTIGTSPILRLRTGAPPASCASADAGTVLVSMTLPSDWAAAASAGSKAKAGTWSGVGVAAGIAAHYRLYASDGTTCHEQGTITLPGADPLGDMLLDNTSIAVDQVVTLATATLTDGNA